MLCNNAVSQEPLNVLSPILDQIGAVESVKAASDIVEFPGLRLLFGSILILADPNLVRTCIRYCQGGE